MIKELSYGRFRIGNENQWYVVSCEDLKIHTVKVCDKADAFSIGLTKFGPVGFASTSHKECKSFIDKFAMQ